MATMKKTVDTLLIALLSTHLFCCVLPTVVSLLAVFSGLGFLGFGTIVEELHHHIHDFELPILIFSFVTLCLGWVMSIYAHRAACCHETGCEHEPCAPTKHRAYGFLVLATLLFLVNIAIYTGERLIHAH